MAANDPGLKQVLDAIKRALNSKASKESRARKEKRINAIGIDSDEIYKEIISKYSPFKVENSGYTNNDLKTIAVEIADTLWKEFKRNAKGTIYDIKDKDAESKFVNHSENSVAILFDDANRLVYLKSGKGKNNQESFLSNLIRPVKAALDKYPEKDPARIFFNPNKDYLEKKNKINSELRAALLAYISSDEKLKTQFDTPKKINNKLDNIRKRGDSFSNYPKDYWKNKLVELKTSFGGANVDGVQLGHIFGGQVSVATALVADIDSFVANFDRGGFEEVSLLSSIPAKYVDSVKSAIIKVSIKDANLEYERKVRPNLIQGEITILLPELTDKNQKEGQEAQDAFNKYLVPELRKIQNEILLAKGSPSFQELLRRYIDEAFLGKSHKYTTFNTKKTIKRKDQNVSVNIGKLSSAKLVTRTTLSRKAIKEETSSPNLQDLINLININFHDKIQENMGKGGAKQILNYRTGRFARSAKVQTLTPSREKGMIEAQVKYMRYPYGVFEPGGRLHKPGRDPHRIFARSIRQILQEQKIANLRRVKVNLNG